MRIKFYFDKLQLKFLNWLSGNGFRMPEPTLKDQCMYNYYKSIAEGREISKIDAYEKKLEELMEKFPKATREVCAGEYVKALKLIYGKEIY